MTNTIIFGLSGDIICAFGFGMIAGAIVIGIIICIISGFYYGKYSR